MPPKLQHASSRLLSAEENESVFAAIGARRVSQATSVVQLFEALPDRSAWTKRTTGVACLVKDGVVRSYYVRVFAPHGKEWEQVFEQEIFQEFE